MRLVGGVWVRVEIRVVDAGFVVVAGLRLCSRDGVLDQGYGGGFVAIAVLVSELAVGCSCAAGSSIAVVLVVLVIFLLVVGVVRVVSARVAGRRSSGGAVFSVVL